MWLQPGHTAEAPVVLPDHRVKYSELFGSEGHCIDMVLRTWAEIIRVPRNLEPSSDVICTFPLHVRQKERKDQREREQRGGSYSANKGGRERREGCGGGMERGREREGKHAN